MCLRTGTCEAYTTGHVIRFTDFGLQKVQHYKHIVLNRKNFAMSKYLVMH